ncbi:hypothetical protein S40288_11768 [Stachybotrys chartarum IBT 40288]|nr:hypothetical protein S40288_11768 [Stachybotrys chartarum IBT 40288]
MEHLAQALYCHPTKHLEEAPSVTTDPASSVITRAAQSKTKSQRNILPSRKVKEAGSWEAILYQVRKSSVTTRRKQRKPGKQKRGGYRQTETREPPKNEVREQNRFLDGAGEFVGFPSIQELCLFESNDWGDLFEASTK